MTTRQAVVADDDEDMRRELARIGRAAGFTVVETSSAQGALKAVDRIEHAGGGVDIVVSDVAMPGIDGIELTRRLRRTALAARHPRFWVHALGGHRSRCPGSRPHRRCEANRPHGAVDADGGPRQFRGVAVCRETPHRPFSRH
jgi:CheY-like chemotaxis protein